MKPTLGQVAYAEWHKMPVEMAARDWPEGDRNVKKWEAVGAAVRDAVREETAQGTMPAEVQRATIAWMVNDDVGVSSQTMAAWLAFDVRPDEPRHPLDPSDLNRCLVLLDRVPALREKLPRMAELSPEWAGLVAQWDDLERCFLDEAGLGWTKTYRAPNTLLLMRKALG